MYMKNLEQELKENVHTRAVELSLAKKQGRQDINYRLFYHGTQLQQPQPCICRRWKRGFAPRHLILQS